MTFLSGERMVHGPFHTPWSILDLIGKLSQKIQSPSGITTNELGRTTDFFVENPQKIQQIDKTGDNLA